MFGVITLKAVQPCLNTPRERAEEQRQPEPGRLRVPVLCLWCTGDEELSWVSPASTQRLGAACPLSGHFPHCTFNVLTLFFNSYFFNHLN